VDPDRWAERRKIIAEIVAIPAVLAFPPEIYRRLDQLCELRGWTHQRLILEAMRIQASRLAKIGDKLLSSLPPGEIEVWPKDPIDILARAVVIHCMRLFVKSFHDPVGYEETKKKAPAQWSFCSIEDEPADWWEAEE
jgi:hypothetical protein